MRAAAGASGRASSLNATVPQGERVHTTVTWDGRSDTGEVMPPGTHAITLDPVAGGQTRPHRAGVEMTAR